MSEFDQVAYEAACELFHSAKRIRNAIPSLVQQIADSVDMLGAQRYDSDRVSGGGGNRVEQAMVDSVAAHEALMARLEERRSQYVETIMKCEAAVSDMEDHGEGDALDSAILRYYYMQDMDVPEAVRELERQSMNYTASWLYQKKEIALVRVAAAVRRLGFL